MVRKVNLAEAMGRFDEHWNPKIVGQVNDTQIKLAKLQGEFVWHRHDDEDELFLVLKGNLLMKLRDGDIEIGDPLRFADGNGVDPPEPSDTDASGFGELLVLSIVNGAPLVNYPILRIEFDLIAEILGDFDGDGDVDLADYVRLQTLFTGTSSSPGGGKLNEADFDADGDVDLADMLTFLEHFTGPGVQLAVAQGP